MINGFWNGLSGINSHEKALGAESNNVTNVNTTAYKSDRVSFADLMYRDSGYGTGAATQIVEKNFKQGDLKDTGHNFDAAIDGKGYFIVKDTVTSDVYYTRAGNFKVDSTGFLTTSDGMKVQGIQTAAPTIISTDPTASSFTKEYSNQITSKSVFTDNFVSTINARATNYVQSAKTSGDSGQGYKTASAKIADIGALIANYKEKLDLYSSNSNATSIPSTASITEVPYSNFLNFLNDSNDVIKLTVDGNIIKQSFDTDVQTTMNKFADKISNLQGLTASVDTNGVLKITSLIPGKDVRILDAAINTYAPGINPITIAKDGSGAAMVTSARNALKTALESADAKFLELTNTVTLPTTAAIVQQDIQLKPNLLNLSDADFGQITIEEGKIFLKDGNNKYVIGAISTAFFNDEQSLNPEGSNLFTSSNLSGPAQNAYKYNTVVGKNLELSNTSFASNLSNMLVYQRAFDANSKSLTTSDELLKTAIQLKR